MGYGDEGEMGYRVWLPQGRKIVRSRDVVFNEAKLLKLTTQNDLDKKEVKFQHDQPAIQQPLAEDSVPFDAENEQQPIVLQPEDNGQQIDAQDGIGQQEEHVENRLQQQGNGEYQPPGDGVHIPEDVGPLLDSRDHWVRRSTRVRRQQPQRFQPSLDCIPLIDEGEPLTFREVQSCENKRKWELAM